MRRHFSADDDLQFCFFFHLDWLKRWVKILIETWIKTMTSSKKESSICSPESTISSLLTSYSIDSSNPYSDSLIQYKDKLYSSASEALEAYIEDFDRSLTSLEISTGKICICQSTPKQAQFVKYHARKKHGKPSANMAFNKFWCVVVFCFVFNSLPMVLQLLVSHQVCFVEGIFHAQLLTSLYGVVNDAWSWQYLSFSVMLFCKCLVDWWEFMTTFIDATINSRVWNRNCIFYMWIYAKDGVNCCLNWVLKKISVSFPE